MPRTERKHGTKTMYEYELKLIKEGKLDKTCSECRAAKRTYNDASSKARYRAFTKLARNHPDEFRKLYEEAFFNATLEDVQRDSSTAVHTNDGGKAS